MKISRKFRKLGPSSLSRPIFVVYTVFINSFFDVRCATSFSDVQCRRADAGKKLISVYFSIIGC